MPDFEEYFKISCKPLEVEESFELKLIETEIIEKDLSPVYYKIDKFDLIFLNSQRKIMNIPDDLFALIMQRIHEETEYLKYSIKDSLKDLIKIFPRNPASYCDICGEEENLYSCKHCNITVHKDCYGILKGIKSHEFVCEACKNSLLFPKCILCFNENGAMYPFNIQNIGLERVYCHFTCILYNPHLEILSYGELNLSQNIFQSIECYYCKSTEGAVIKCTERHCNTQYHVYCGLLNTYFSKNSTRSYCEKHQQGRVSREGNQDLNYTQEYLNKRYAIPPNTYVMDLILSSDLCTLKIERKEEILMSIYKYYDIKQKVLESTSSFNKVDLERVGDWFERRSIFCLKKSEEHKDCVKVFEISNEITEVQEINGMKQIPEEMVDEYIHFLELKRELKEKEEQLKIKEENLKEIRRLKELEEKNGSRLPIIYCLRALDVPENNLFKYPVTEDIASEYFSIIEKPMDFETINKKLEDEKYNWEDFCEDIELIINNCREYNKDNKYYVNKAGRLNNMFNEQKKKLSNLLEDKQILENKEIEFNNKN